MKIYQAIADKLTAISNCRLSKNREWETRHEHSLGIIMDSAPSGSGLDSGTKFLRHKSNSSKLVFSTSYHHLNNDGYYEGWTDHVVTVTPAFHNIDVSVSGRNRNEVKSLIADTFYHWLIEDYVEQE